MSSPTAHRHDARAGREEGSIHIDCAVIVLNRRPYSGFAGTTSEGDCGGLCQQLPSSLTTQPWTLRVCALFLAFLAVELHLLGPGLCRGDAQGPGTACHLLGNHGWTV